MKTIIVDASQEVRGFKGFRRIRNQVLAKKQADVIKGMGQASKEFFSIAIFYDGYNVRLV